MSSSISPSTSPPSHFAGIASPVLGWNLKLRWKRFLDLPFFTDINAAYVEVLRYPTLDKLTIKVLWLHFGTLTVLVLAHVQLHLATRIPSPLGWREVALPQGLLAIALGLVAAGIPTLLHSRVINHYLWRIITAGCLAIYSYLFILVSGGAIEMYFHFFLVMTYMSVYGDWRIGWWVLGFLTVQHVLLDMIAPFWVYFYGRNGLSPLVHAVFVIVMAVFTTILCRNYRNAVTALVRQKQRNDEFLAIASHELKTPLTSLNGYIEVLQRRLKRSSDEGSLAYANKIDDQLHKITGLVRDLLDISKIQSGLVDFHEDMMSMETVVDQAVEEVKAFAHHHQIEVVGNLRVMVYGDKVRLCQVMVNLLSNAIKYSAEADKVIVSVVPARERVVVSVQDFGIGMSVEDQAKIFDPYFRGTATRREDVPGGLGMGLYICAEIIRRHHGRIWVESVDGGGSTFSFYLPLPKIQERLIP